MKTKVKPNKHTQDKGLINYTLNFGKNKVKEEKGITLIVLLITVILLVILTGVAVAQITGDEGIIGSSETAVDDYKYQQYKEQLEQLMHSIILADSIAGRTTTVTSMAEDMLNEAWIKEAIPDEEAKDIIVTVEEGYVYQVYYDEETGLSGVEGIGTSDGASLPTVKANYDKENYTINVVASSADGISKIELIYKEEVVQTANADTASFEVDESGWYQVKATSSKGKTRYVNVRVSNEVNAPSIAVTSEGAKENDWYGKDNVPVEVTITGDTNVARIYYRKSTETDYTNTEGKTAKVTINTSGRTVIYAYAADSKGNESDIVRIEIKYDNVKPEVGAIVVSPEAPASGWYNTDVVVSLSNATDDTSGIAGYYYWEVTGDTAEVPEEEKTYVSGASKSLTIKSEGIRTIAFQAVDKAGNLSVTSTLTVQKDSLSPKDFTISISNQNKTGFTINAGTTDDTSMVNDVSGLDYYEIYLNGSKIATIEITDQTNPTISHEVSKLKENVAYTVSVKAFDKAGNIKESPNTIGQTGEIAGGNQGGSSGGIDFGNGETYEESELVGKYVDYTPVQGSFTAQATYTGYTNDQAFSTVDTLKWRILFAENGKLTLIADTITMPTLALKGHEGYNNGVLLLNETCKALYSNTPFGAEARSLNIDDIEKVSSYDKTTYTSNGYSYGNEYTPATSYRRYPSIYQYEKTGAPNGIYGTLYDLSNQTGYVTGSENGDGAMKGKWTYYTYTLGSSFMNPMYVELFRYQAGTTTDLTQGYWLASRCVSFESSRFYYRVFYVSNGTLQSSDIYLSDANPYSASYALRPVVEIDLSKVNVGETGDGSRDNPYSLAQKTSGGTQEPDEPGINFGDMTEDEFQGYVGKYVDYVPTSGSFTSQGQYNGSSDQNFTTQEGLKWRILFADSGKLTLISDTTTNTGFTLNGANGYNNGVLLLNNACKAMYSNSLLGAVGRNLKVEEVEKMTEYNDRPNKSWDIISDAYKYYPAIFAKEVVGTVEGIKGIELEQSEQKQYYTGSTRASKLKGEFTYYTAELSKYCSDTELEILAYSPDNQSYYGTYWIASRCINQRISWSRIFINL